MAVYKKEYSHLIGSRAYLIWPFYTALTNEDLKKSVLFLYDIGVTPVISSTYIVPRNFHILDRNNIYQTISMCECAIVMEENHMTQTMLAEVAYCRRLGLPVYTIS